MYRGIRYRGIRYRGIRYRGIRYRGIRYRGIRYRGIIGMRREGKQRMRQLFTRCAAVATGQVKRERNDFSKSIHSFAHSLIDY
jgi:hypothetical protein